MEITPEVAREVTEDLAAQDLVVCMELRRLVDEYALAADAFDNERFVALFTADGTFERDRSGSHGTVHHREWGRGAPAGCRTPIGSSSRPSTRWPTTW